MADDKCVAKLTSGESLLLMVTCAVTGAVFGVLMYLSALSTDLFSHYIGSTDRLILGLYLLLLLLGPGTWFSFFGKFGTRGPERRAFMRGTWWRFNALAWGVGIVAFALLYICRLLWS
jgi:hypothetical protein